MSEWSPLTDEEWRSPWTRVYMMPSEWPICLGLCLTHACSLRVASEQGWWDAAGYHRDEVKLTRRHVPANKGPAWTSGSPQAGALNVRAA